MPSTESWSTAPDRLLLTQSYTWAGSRQEGPRGISGREGSPCGRIPAHSQSREPRHGLLDCRRPPGNDGAGHDRHALDLARLSAPVGLTDRRGSRARNVDVLGNTCKGQRPHHLAEEVPMMERAVRISRRLDMDRRKSAVSVENRVGRTQCGRRPDVQHADARNADAPQVPSFRSPNEQWPPSPKVRKPQESPM